MTHVPMDDGHQLEQAAAVLETGCGLIDQALSTLKTKTMDGDRVSAAKLDEFQLISYELSVSWSECTAARFLLAHARRLEADSSADNAFTARLAALFCAEAVTNCVNRLRTRPTDFGLSDANARNYNPDPVGQLADSTKPAGHFDAGTIGQYHHRRLWSGR